MVKPLVLNIGQGRSRIYWNLDSNVGLNCPNLAEDVLLVQFGFYAVSINPRKHSQYKPVYGAVPLDGRCSGREGDPLITAIRTYQQEDGGAHDGRVSLMKESASYDGKHAFLLLSLNNNMFDAVPNDFPRIDKHPKCPPVLRDVIKRCCVH